MDLFDGKDDIDGCGQLFNTEKYTVKVGLPGNSTGRGIERGKTWVDLLRETDDIIEDNDKYKSMIGSGELNSSSTGINIKSKTDINKFSCNFNDDKSLNEYGLSSLNKLWGGGTEVFNNGCVSENVFIPCSKINVVYADILNRKPEFKKVLQLEAHGDNYTGSVKGLEQNQMKYKQEDMDIPTCPQKNHIETGKRVGGVVSTNRNFGPGSYEVIARVPKTSAPTGRGYVFAMWTFHYEEHYNKVSDQQFVTNNDYIDYNPLDEDGNEFCVINHEIDIEIPANPNNYLGRKKNQDVFKWNTMNMNTWIGDNLKYDKSAWYREIVAIPKNINKTFISENGEFHSYKFIWHVPKNNTDTSDIPYVDFYFDNEKIYREKCFVPSRSGKFLIGPWFGWWGFDQEEAEDGTTINKANFDTVAVLVSEIIIIPDTDSKIVEYPQNYDQIASYGSANNKTLNLACDFGQNYTNICNTCNIDQENSSIQKTTIWMWLFISLIIIFIITIILILFIKRKNNFKIVTD